MVLTAFRRRVTRVTTSSPKGCDLSDIRDSTRPEIGLRRRISGAHGILVCMLICLPCRRSRVRVSSPASALGAGSTEIPTRSRRAFVTKSSPFRFTGALALAVLCSVWAPSAPASDAVASSWSSPPITTVMSHYGTSRYGDRSGDQYLYQRTSCGRIVTPDSTFVAALSRDLARCGLKLTIYHRGRRYHVRVQDRGGYRSDRHLDAAPGLRRRLGFSGLATVRYAKGWR